MLLTQRTLWGRARPCRYLVDNCRARAIKASSPALAPEAVSVASRRAILPTNSETIRCSSALVIRAGTMTMIFSPSR
jgi:hypothetical protein